MTKIIFNENKHVRVLCIRVCLYVPACVRFVCLYVRSCVRACVCLYKHCSSTCCGDFKDHKHTQACTYKYTLQTVLSEHVDHTMIFFPMQLIVYIFHDTI